jgi:RNA polymerase sigma-70 factor (ECF subfamily)
MNRSRRAGATDEIQDVRSAVRIVLRRLVGAEDPEYEDLVQSAIEHVLVTFERGRFRGDCPRGGWAAVIARNVAVDAIRARSRERQLFVRDPGDLTVGESARGLDAGVGPAGPEHLLVVQERMRRLQGALLGLGMHKANVVFLHDVLGHELGDISAILGVTVAAAQSRLSRGRREIIARIGAGERADRPDGTKTATKTVGKAVGPTVAKAVVLTGASGRQAGRKQPRRRTAAMLS